MLLTISGESTHTHRRVLDLFARELLHENMCDSKSLSGYTNVLASNTRNISEALLRTPPSTLLYFPYSYILPLSASSIRCLQTACHRRVNMRISQSSRQTRDDDDDESRGQLAGSAHRSRQERARLMAMTPHDVNCATKGILHTNNINPNSDRDRNITIRL